MPSLSATHLYLYAHCEHRVHLELRGDSGVRLADTEEERALKARGIAHEAAIADALAFPRPAHGPEARDRAFEETLALMRAGEAGIYQGVLLAEDLIGVPDLLIRQPGASHLGDHHYTVADVKISQRARADQALQVAFYAHLLEKVQGVLPSEVYLILGDGSREAIASEDLGGVFEQALADVRAIRDGGRATDPFFQDACPRCPWRGLCLPELEARDDLSLLPGMTRSRRGALARSGFETVSTLAAARPERAATRSGLERRSLLPLIRQAQAAAKRAILPLSPGPRPEGPPELLVTAHENPENAGHTVLLTISLSDIKQGNRTALIWAADPSDEKALYEKALRAFSRRPHAPVYHHGRSAVWQLARLESRYGSGSAGLQALHRMTDVAPLVRRAAALPVQRYTLAEAARATGYAGELPPEEILPLTWRAAGGDEEAREGLLAAAASEREALQHLIGWLRSLSETPAGTRA
ncbi:MAG: TM0106 family RecB-like putative nuclease [Deltaproteobacteria bacterium]|nr:TM0106 family RecB-like putative nuclease [Deltaproteobacteria bacterium]